MSNDANVRAADPRNVQLPGKVSLWFRKKGSVDAADWKDLGNVIDPQLAEQLEELEHFSHRRGQRGKDRVLTSERSAQLNFSIDEINTHNLQFAFGNKQETEVGTVDVNDDLIVTNPGGTAPANTIQLPDEDIVPGSVIVRSPMLGVDEVTYSTPGDYTVDASTGIITIVSSGALNINDEDAPTGVPELHIFYRKEVESQKFEMFPGDEITGEAKFQVLTPGGLQYVAEFGNVTIKNNGDISIGDGTAFQQIPLTMNILVDPTGVLGTMHVIGEDEL